MLHLHLRDATLFFVCGAMAQGGGESVAHSAFFFCSFAGCVSSIPGHFLLGRHQRLTFGLFGSRERLDFLCFALGLQGEFSRTGSLFS